MRRLNNDKTLVLKDIIPAGELECLDHYDGNNELVWVKVNLRDTILEDGSRTRPGCDYVRHLLHTEEKEEIIAETIVRYDNFAMTKTRDVKNIEYVTGVNSEKDSEFASNVRHDLRVRGFTTSNGTMPASDGERQSLLRFCLETGYLLRINRNALKINEEAASTRYANPGECIPCDLHSKNRGAEKIVQQLLIAGMRMLGPGELDDYVGRVEEAVNTLILNRTTRNDDESGSWAFPLTKDGKKLGDVTFLNPMATKFIGALELLLPVCVDRYEITV